MKYSYIDTDTITSATACRKQGVWHKVGCTLAEKEAAVARSSEVYL